MSIALLRPEHSNSICPMTTGVARDFPFVFGKLKEYGVLLESDPKLPSVCGLLVGEPLSGSWWSHPLAQRIFHVSEQLADDPDVLITRLVSSKVTFVHRTVWPEVFAISTAREAWQTKGLSTAARRLLRMIDEAASLRTDNLVWPGSAKSKPGEAARELERKLLVHSEQLHTQSGAHAKMLETWSHWAARRGFKAAKLSPDEAKRTLEAKIATLNRLAGATAKLPWQSR